NFFQHMSFLERGTKLISPLRKPGAKPPLEGLYVYVFSALVGYMAADLTILSYRDDMLPTQAPPSRPIRTADKGDQLADLSAIRDKNIFQPDGVIPPALRADEAGEGGSEADDAPAVLSQLPLTLEGTIVHLNPR